MLRKTWAQTFPVTIAACVALAVGSASAVGAARPRVALHTATSTTFCKEVGATGAVVHRIFGKHATTLDVKATTEKYCQITPAKAPTTGPTQGCSGIECTDIFISGPRSRLAADLAYEVAELKEYGGGVSTRPVAGAGSGAVLLTARSYGDPSYGLGPVLFFGAGSRALAIQGSLGGKPNFSKWEKLAHSVYVHLA